MFEVDYRDLEYRVKKYVVTFFDLTTKAARKEFNSVIFFYTIALLTILYLITDFDAVNNAIFNTMGELQYKTATGEINQQQAANESMQAIAPLVPSTFLSCFVLLLLPLYIRRLNDTMFHTIGFAFPIVTVYIGDALCSIFGASIHWGVYDLMGVYTFLMTAILCIFPSQEQDLDDPEIRR